MNAGRPFDALERVTTKPNLPEHNPSKYEKDDECINIYESLICQILKISLPEMLIKGHIRVSFSWILQYSEGLWVFWMWKELASNTCCSHKC